MASMDNEALQQALLRVVKDRQTLLSKITGLRNNLLDDIRREQGHLRSISGPTGMRNSPASVAGLARNDIRREVIERLKKILDEKEGCR
jgi:hypothetical protein